VYEAFTFTSKDGLTRVERDKNLIGIISQGRFRLLANECAARGIELDCLGACIPGWTAHVERYEKTKGFGSHQFWNGLRVALELDGIIGCCPLVAPSSLPYSSWDGMSADWGCQLLPKRPIYDFLCASPELQQRLVWKLTADKPWFALTRRATLDRTVKQGMERTGQVITVYKKGSRVAACKGSFRTGQLRAIQSTEDWCVWASRAAIGTGTQEERVRGLKRRLDSIRLTADGVVPLDLTCLSSREAQLGPVGAAYTRSGIVAATDGSLRKSGAMGAAYVTKDNRLPPRSVAVFGQPSSIRPELTGIALALEDCPGGEDLNILTDSLSSMRLLKSMQRKDFPLQLYRHPVRQLLLHVVRLINKRTESGRATRFIKVRAHRGEPLNEKADALAAEAAELDPARPLAMDQDPEAVYFLHKETWVEWDARVREDLVQRAAKRCVARLLRPRRGRMGAEASPPTLTLTAAWMLRPNQGRSMLGQVLGEMRISAAKKQILQSIAGAFPGNAVLHKWRIVSSPACALCGHPAETQSHIQCLCPALQEARIRAHHNIAKRLWQGIMAVTKEWVITTEQTVEGLLGLPQPEGQIDEWQRAWDELTDVHLEGEGWETDAATAIQRKRPDAWAVHWGKRNLFILEFTRPNDRCATALQDTDAYKRDRYTPLQNRLAGHLAGWQLGILTFTIGIRGSYDPDKWHANLTCFGLTAAQTDCLMRELVAQTLTELTDLYSVRYAALQHRNAGPKV
jgi:ribonuclease HI